MTSPLPSVLAMPQGHDIDGRRVWIVRADVVPDYYGRIFLTEGPDIFLEPVGYFCTETLRPGESIFSPWIPVTQETMLFTAPTNNQGWDIRLRGDPMPGVTLGATIVN